MTIRSRAAKAAAVVGVAGIASLGLAVPAQAQDWWSNKDPYHVFAKSPLSGGIEGLTYAGYNPATNKATVNVWTQPQDANDIEEGPEFFVKAPWLPRPIGLGDPNN